MTNYIFSITILSLLFLPSECRALSLVISSDSYTDSSRPNIITEEDTSTRKRLLVANLDGGFGDFLPGTRAAFFKHDTSSLPASTSAENIVKASVKLWVSKVIQEGTLLFHAVNEDWDESTLNHNNRPAISPFFSAINVTSSDEGHWITVDITKQFMNWVTLPSTNFGLAVSAAPLPGNQAALIEFGSKESIFVDVIQNKKKVSIDPNSGYPSKIDVAMNNQEFP